MPIMAVSTISAFTFLVNIRTIAEIIVAIINSENTIRYSLLLAFLFEIFGVSTKSNLFEIQMVIIPKINARLTKFRKYETKKYSS